LDDAGYQRLVTDAHRLFASPDYNRLHATISALLERDGTVDQATLQHVKSTIEAGMEHKRLNVIDTDIGEGEMIALASTWQVDRVKDRVVPGAYAQTVNEIKGGAYLPLVWQHAYGSPTNFVGEVVDADETHDGLRIRARFDMDDDAGRKAFKLVKRGSIKSLSIGYNVLEKRRAPGGITELVKVQLNEVSLALAPANEGARVLSVKGDDDPLDVLREQHRALMQALLDASSSAPRETLRQKSDRYAREHAPIVTAEFEC
jgi:HK97 family phage prohead protease